jgi:hypothetical protein
MKLAKLHCQIALRKIFAAVQQLICFCHESISAKFAPGTTVMEVRRVDLTMKLNVLAVGAAFFFVGAVLLGAF